MGKCLCNIFVLSLFSSYDVKKTIILVWCFYKVIHLYIFFLLNKPFSITNCKCLLFHHKYPVKNVLLIKINRKKKEEMNYYHHFCFHTIHYAHGGGKRTVFVAYENEYTINTTYKWERIIIAGYGWTHLEITKLLFDGFHVSSDHELFGRPQLSRLQPLKKTLLGGQ